LLGCRSSQSGTAAVEIGLGQSNRSARTSFIAALDVGGVLPCTLPVVVRPPPSARRRRARRPPLTRAAAPRQGTTNAFIFEAWFFFILIPTLLLRHPGGCTVVMDNAKIHRPLVLRAMVALTNITLAFLPAYSPELQPVRGRARAGHTRAHTRATLPPADALRRTCSDRAAVRLDEVCRAPHGRHHQRHHRARRAAECVHARAAGGGACALA
jgi:hypothetical protein